MTPTANSNNNNNTDRTQYVWIVRYGLTEFPLVESVGPFDSDIDPNEGIRHAQAIATRIAAAAAAAAKPDAETDTGTSDDPPADAVPTLIYASPFLRTVHTAHIIAKALPDSINGTTSKPVKIEEGLTEWQVSSLLVEPDGKRTFPKSTQIHATKFDTIDVEYKSLNPTGSSNIEKLEEESEQQLYQRCQLTLQKILAHSEGQQNNIVIVSHAPCDIVMALALNNNTTLEQAKGADTNKYPAWPLGGLTLFSRKMTTACSNSTTAPGNWKMEMYGDSNHMPGEYKEGIKRWTLPSLS